jgi:hypothetical protein
METVTFKNLPRTSSTPRDNNARNFEALQGYSPRYLATSCHDAYSGGLTCPRRVVIFQTHKYKRLYWLSPKAHASRDNTRTTILRDTAHVIGHSYKELKAFKARMSSAPWIGHELAANCSAPSKIKERCIWWKTTAKPMSNEFPEDPVNKCRIHSGSFLG